MVDNMHNDQIAVVNYDPTAISHSNLNIGGGHVTEIAIYFTDPTGKAISSNALPSYPPD